MFTKIKSHTLLPFPPLSSPPLPSPPTQAGLSDGGGRNSGGHRGRHRRAAPQQRRSLIYGVTTYFSLISLEKNHTS